MDGKPTDIKSADSEGPGGTDTGMGKDNSAGGADATTKDTATKDAAPIPIPPWVTSGTFHGECSPSLLYMDPSKGLPPATAQNPWESVRDPSMVFYNNRWHLFASILKRMGGESGRVRIGYMSFPDWSQAQAQDWRKSEIWANSCDSWPILHTLSAMQRGFIAMGFFLIVDILHLW